MARKTLHGNVVATKEGEEMGQKKFQLDETKADLNNDGELSSYERARGEAVQKAMAESDATEMMMGGLMMDSDPFAPMQVVIGMDPHSGNEVPAGSKDEEVRDDIPALLSEGEYVVPADVVRYHGLKTFEELRCEAKHALGLMAMHDRISMVDEDTKEPVEYDIEEKDAPEVEKAEVKVVEAQEGTSVESTAASEDAYNYILQYVKDPVTGMMTMAYVDPMTGQQISKEEYDISRATRFSPQKILERDVYGITPGEKEEEDDTTTCPPGYTFDDALGQCVPIVTTGQVATGDGDGPQDDDRGMELSDEFETSALSELEKSLGLGTNFGSQYGAGAAPSSGSAVGVVFGPLGALAEKAVNGIKKSFAKNDVYDAISKNLGITKPEARELVKTEYVSSVADKVRSGESDYEDVEIGGNTYGVTRGGGVVGGRTTLTPNEASRRAASRVMDISTSSSDDDDDRGSGLTSTRDLGGREDSFTGSRGVDENVGPGGQRSGGDDRDDSPSDGDAGDLSEDDGPGDQGYGPSFAKGGMPYRKNTPRKTMIKYSKGSN